MLLNNYREGAITLLQGVPRWPGSGGGSTDLSQNGRLAATEVITAIQDQSCIQKIKDDSVSKDTRKTSKRSWGQISSHKSAGWGGGVNLECPPLGAA